MPDRRPMGALETDVLRALWATTRPSTPAEVLQRLGADLAYTTVMTILTRLWRKGLVEREQQGRAFAYRPLVSEADLTAKRMKETLSATKDREAALTRFVDSLSKRDERALRRVLDDLEDTR